MGSLLQRVLQLKGRVSAALKGVPPKKQKLSVKLLSDSQARQGLPPSEEVRRLEHELACKARLGNLVQVNQPLVLISQVQRSGGTLLSQLFDMHPQCHAHPHYLYMGAKCVWPTWPTLDLKLDPDSWVPDLFEAAVVGHFASGYTKYGKGIGKDADVFPFIFLPSLQREIFRQCVAARKVACQRDVFDCYFTSYFNAWLDNQNLYRSPKKIITAFRPRMTIDPENVRKFFASYPDGKVISIVREPKSWYTSARKQFGAEVRDGTDYSKPAEAIELWMTSTQSILAARSQHPNDVCVIAFEDLLADTEGTMRRLAAFTGIDYHPTLLTPTFNGFPIKADSGFGVKQHGVLKDPIQRHKDHLAPDQAAVIDRRTAEVYAAALALTRGQPHRLTA